MKPERSIYFDRQRQPISLERWTELRRLPGYYRIGLDVIGDVEVSTVWIGIDLGFYPSQLFETMTFSKREPWDSRTMGRYSTEAAAVAGHLLACAAVRSEEGAGT